MQSTAFKTYLQRRAAPLLSTQLTRHKDPEAGSVLASGSSRSAHVRCASAKGSDSTLCTDVFTKLEIWLVKHDRVQTLPTKLQPAPHSSGHGMVCEEDVEVGQVLVRIPKALMMTQETAKASKVCGPLIKDTGLNEWQALLLHLLCERALGTSSFWSPYIDSLPDQSMHPLMWGPEQLAVLQGSPMMDTLKSRMQQVEEDCDSLLIAGANDLEVAKTWSKEHGQDMVCLESVRWAAATLLSRAFSLDLAEEEPMEADMSYFGTWQLHSPDMLALVPWADFLDHSMDAGPESSLSYNAELGAASLAAHRQYKAGEHVYGSFGESLSPCDLLLDYGFVETDGRSSGLSSGGSNGEGEGEGGGPGGPEGRGTDGHEELGVCDSISGVSCERYEAALLDIATPTSSRGRTLMGALLNVQGPKARLALTLDGPDTAALSCVRGALASDADLVRAGWRVKATEKDTDLACRVMGTLYNPLNVANETKVLEAFKSYIERQLQAYPTTLEQDEAKLADKSTTWLERQIRLALVSEKLCLVNSLEVVSGKLELLKGGCVSLEDLHSDDSGEVDS